MTAPNMATITASLERSLQNCSLNSHGGSGGGRGGSGGGGFGRSSSSDDVSHISNNNNSSSGATLELNSHISLPYHWEQCLDLKTGEIYYINWRTGMKAKEDPRMTTNYSGDCYYSDEDEDDSSNYDSEESSSESSPTSYSSAVTREPSQVTTGKDHVLVVGGCKTCLMYYMVPKQVEDCPKCGGQLLHFDRSENGSL